MQEKRTFHPAVFYLLFFASGAAGLIYQSLWLRQFALVLGNSLYSATVVLAAFMFGLAGGAWLFGRFLRGRGDALLYYALIELGIGLSGLIAGYLIPRIGPLSAWLLGSLPPWPLLAGFIRFVLSFAVLLVPTALIGGALPVLAQYVVRSLEFSGRRVGGLYGWNAAGALTGCLLTGFWLLRLVGTHNSLLLAAGINFLITVVALILRSRPGEKARPAENVPAGSTRPRVLRHGLPAGSLLVAAGLTGAILLACEPVWARFLSYILFNDMYVYYLMISVILAGIGLGSLLYSLWLERRLTSLSALAWLEVALGLSIVVCYLLSAGHYIDPGSGLALKRLQGYIPDRFLGLLAIRMAYAAAVMFLPALLSGIIFPLTCRLYYHDERRIGEDTGVIYAVNTLGAAAGVFLSGLLLIPLLGVQWCLFLLAAAALGLGLWLILFASGRKLTLLRASGLAAATALFIVLVILPDNQVRAIAVKDRAHHEVLSYREGLSGTVMVTRDRFNGLKNLYINAIAEVHNSFGGMQTFKLMGHLPFLLHSGQPQSVLMVTYGAGIASGAVAVHPLRELHVVELEPAVIEASVFFKEENRSVMDDPRLRIHLEDGRNFLHTTDRDFDIIITDATNPGSIDSWLLYTVEFYRLCRKRLSTGGVMAQWLPLHSGTPESYNAVLKAFQTVFPHTSIWFTKDYTLLVGLPSRLEVSWPGLQRRMTDPSLRADLAPWCLDRPIQMVECFLMSENAVREMSSAARPNTDDRPFYQFNTGDQSGTESILAMLERYRQRENVFLRAVDTLVAKALSDSLEIRFQAEQYLLARDYPAAEKILPEACNISRYAQEYREEPDYLVRSAEANPESYFVQLRAAVGLTGHGEYGPAREIFIRLLSLDPDEPSLYMNMGNLYLRSARPDSAVIFYRLAMDKGRRDSYVLGRLGEALLKSDEPEQALTTLLDAVELDPKDEEALFHLGYAHSRTGSPDKAIQTYEGLVTLNPAMPNAFVNLGYLYLGQRNESKARETFHRAVNLLPESFQGWYGLGTACLWQGDTAAAAGAFSRALELRPGDPEISTILEDLR